MISLILVPLISLIAASKRGKETVSLSKLDFGILEVAMMLAALDGEILREEYDAFLALAKSCRGYTPENAKKCLDEALHQAGYLMAIAKIGCYTERERLDAFTDMAIAALPRGFADGDLADLRRAFFLWVTMGVSDGVFSSIERQAIDTLQDRLAQVMATQASQAEANWSMLKPGYFPSSGPLPSNRKITLLEFDFADKAAALTRALADASTRAEAEIALTAFINPS